MPDPPPTLYRCHVKAIAADGLDVRVWELDADAFIPAVEAFGSNPRTTLVWSKLTDGTEKIGVGDRLLACLIAGKHHLSPTPLFSRRCAIKYQYETIHPGDVVALTITDINDAYIYGRIRGGVQARTNRKLAEESLRRIPLFAHHKTSGRMPTLRETVAGIVTQQYPADNPLFTLDVTGYLNSLARSAVVGSWRFRTLDPHAPSLRSRTSDESGHLKPSTRPELAEKHFRAPPTRYRRVMIVDDDPETCKQLTDFFSKGNYTYTSAASLDLAERLLRSDDSIDLLILDVHWNTTNGIAWAQRIFKYVRRIDIILATTLNDSNEDPLLDGQSLSILVRQSGYPNRFKALWNKRSGSALNELVSILIDVEANRVGAFVQPRPQYPVQANPKELLNSSLRFPLTGGTDFDPELQACLELHLGSFPQSINAAIFSIRRTSLEVSLHSGTPTIQQTFSEVRRHLYKSPIRDLLIDGEAIDEADVADLEAKYRWLFKLLPFDWVLGKQLHFEGQDRTYALFIFGNRAEPLDRCSRLQINLCLKDLELILLRRSLEARCILSEKLAALGVAHQKMAHEVKAKVTYIAQLAATPQGKDGNEVVASTDSLNHLRDFALDCLQITNELLPDAEFSIPPAIDLVPTLARVIDDYEHEHPAPRPDLILRPSLAQPPGVRIRTILLKTIVRNLIANAADFLGLTGRPQGQIVIEVLSRDRGGQLHVEVWCHDAACGVRADVEPFIFDPRFTTKDTGTGYGLAICQDLAATCGGRVELAESILGVGATFVILLPAAQP